MAVPCGIKYKGEWYTREEFAKHLMNNVGIESLAKQLKPRSVADQYVKSIEEAKSKNPETFWSVDKPFQNEDGTINKESLDKAEKEGRLIKTEAGFGVVGEDGDIKGVFKSEIEHPEKTGDKVIQEAIKAGGIKLDNFALPNLMKIYERNGFREVSRLPFNEEYAPEGWNKEKHGTPDVVAMVYDPEGKLPIEKKNFTDYDEAMKYRDSFVIDKNAKNKVNESIVNRIKKTIQKVFGKSDSDVITLSGDEWNKAVEDAKKGENVNFQAWGGF